MCSEGCQCIVVVRWTGQLLINLALYNYSLPCMRNKKKRKLLITTVSPASMQPRYSVVKTTNLSLWSNMQVETLWKSFVQTCHFMVLVAAQCMAQIKIGKQKIGMGSFTHCIPCPSKLNPACRYGRMNGGGQEENIATHHCTCIAEVVRIKFWWCD